MIAYRPAPCVHKWYTVPVTSNDPKVTCMKVCEKCGVEKVVLGAGSDQRARE